MEYKDKSIKEEEELKPCRRCGSQIMAVGKSKDGRWVVFCFRNGCLIVEGGTREEAIRNWNGEGDEAARK